MIATMSKNMNHFESDLALVLDQMESPVNGFGRINKSTETEELDLTDLERAIGHDYGLEVE